MKKSAIILAVVMILAACNKPETPISIADHNTLYAHIEQEAATKTYMDASNNIRWSSGDQVSAFMKTSLGLRYQIKDEYIGKTSGYFSQVSSGSSTDLGAGTEWDHNIVYYPYSDAVEAEKSGPNYSLSVVLPAEQIYSEESFGNGSMAMVAVSEDNNITFKNVLGGMKLQLRGSQKVVSIKLEGKNSEKLSGAATVTAYTDETKPAITMDSGASTSVTLNCGNGVQLSESTATEFIVALPPVLFSKGFTVIVTDSDSKTYTVETDKANTVLRSSLLVMPEVGLDEASLKQSEKHVAVFEFTGAWCLFCPSGYSNMNFIISRNDAYKETVHIMAFHSASGGKDELAIPEADKIMSAMNLDYFPSFITELRTSGGLTDGNSFKASLIEAFEENPSHCAVAVSSQAADGKVKVTAKVHSEQSAPYRIALFVVEDNVKYYQKDFSLTHNEYNHRHVVRKVVSASYMGDRLGDIKAGEEGSKDYEFAVDPAWNLDNTYIYALAIDHSENVNNMNICKINENADYRYVN